MEAVVTKARTVVAAAADVAVAEAVAIAVAAAAVIATAAVALHHLADALAVATVAPLRLLQLNFEEANIPAAHSALQAAGGLPHLLCAVWAL